MIGIKNVFVGHSGIECIECTYTKQAKPDFMICLYNNEIWKYKYKQFGYIPDVVQGDEIITDENLKNEIKLSLEKFLKDKTKIIINYLQVL